MESTPLPTTPVQIECQASPAFQEWIATAGGSLAVSTYQAGKVALIGWDGRQTTLLTRHFDKPLGLAVHGSQLALATRHQVWLFADAPALAPDFSEREPGRYDTLYLPRGAFYTGDLHTHDVVFGGDGPGGLVIVNTRFSCLATLSYQHSFLPLWQPKFITDLVPEDRCHLNGLAMRDGQPRYVTALGTTDAPGAWRANKAAGGVLIDVPSGETMLDGLSMPHSPRWYGGRLWLLNSGRGELLTVDPVSGRADVVCALPGYLRGLGFAGQFALVGMCKIRERHIFGGLPVQQSGVDLHCGVAVIDLRSGRECGMFEFTAGCEELYDIQFLPRVRRPMIVNLDRPEVRESMTYPAASFWLRASRVLEDHAGAQPPVVAAPGTVAAQVANLA